MDAFGLITEILIPGVSLAIRLYTFLIFGNVILSWVRPDPYNPVVRFIRGMTDPYIEMIRRMLPFLRAGMIDFSPIAALLLLELVGSLLIQLLGSLAEQL